MSTCLATTESTRMEFEKRKCNKRMTILELKIGSQEESRMLQRYCLLVGSMSVLLIKKTPWSLKQNKMQKQTPNTHVHANKTTHRPQNKKILRNTYSKNNTKDNNSNNNSELQRIFQKLETPVIRH